MVPVDHGNDSSRHGSSDADSAKDTAPASHMKPVAHQSAANSLAKAQRPLARQAVGRSGADIERLVREARRAARRNGRDLEWADLVNAFGGEQNNRPQKVRWRMAVHEAGHALVQLAVGGARITLISIDAGHGGFVQAAPKTHELVTEARMMAEITVRLAGRAAEELVFTDPVAGSGGSPQSDLAIATGAMVESW